MPPPLLLFRQLAPAQLLRPIPFQVEEGYETEIDPPLHFVKALEAVLVKAQRALQFFEEQFDFPAIMPSKV